MKPAEVSGLKARLLNLEKEFKEQQKLGNQTFAFTNKVDQEAIRETEAKKLAIKYSLVLG